ncbi:MAG: hypothetical protein IJV83_03960 [Clostridia bacterium]|nr:hypothetical protein [Clostridia bacterium]
MGFQKQKFDIIIQAGQSNAEGCGVGAVSQELIPSSNVYYLYAEKEVVVTEENMKITYLDKPFVIEPAKEREGENGILGDFSLTFAEEYEKAGLLADDRALLIIRAGVGGTGFKKKQWGLQDILYLKMLELADYALSLNSENRIVGLLWHQGEHDAFENNSPEIYKEQLSALLNGVRTRYGKEIPFIAGEFVNDWKSKNLDICTPILEKIQQVVSESGNARYVETADLLSNDQKNGNGDDIHFCRESLHILGRRYFVAYQNILNK